MKMISAGSFGIFLFVFLATAALLCLLTGNTRRSYVTLDRSDAVVVAGKTIALEQLAADFQPLLLQRPSDHSPPALTMWWEAIDASDSIALVYHPVWQDERNPVPLLHWIYYAYRAIVYGIPVRDIEYIQININRSNGLIDRVRYEGSTVADYNAPMAQHIRFAIDRVDGDYKETAILPNNEARARSLQLTSSRLIFGIATWSHQFVLLENGAGTYTIPVSMPLEYLTEDNYTKHKLARRSQGDFNTREGIIGSVAKSVMQAVMLGIPYLLSQLRYEKTAS